MVASAACPGPTRATKTRAQIINSIPLLRVMLSLLYTKDRYATFASAPARRSLFTRVPDLSRAFALVPLRDPLRLAAWDFPGLIVRQPAAREDREQSQTRQHQKADLEHPEA